MKIRCQSAGIRGLVDGKTADWMEKVTGEHPVSCRAQFRTLYQTPLTLCVEQVGVERRSRPYSKDVPRFSAQETHKL
jgi:hypothetical protein